MSLNRAVLISPYIPDTTGGGETYLFDVALILSSRFQVEIAVPSCNPLTKKEEANIRKKYERFLGKNLSKVKFVASPYFTSASIFTKYGWSKQYDLLYYVTDGSIFIPGAKRNILHIQTPLKISKKDIISRFKRLFWQVVNTNSEFTKQVVENDWGWQVDMVHHPMIDLKRSANVSSKRKLILNVGRFFKQLHSKRQDILVTMFGKLIQTHPQQLKGWKLVLVGNDEDKDYVKEVKKLAKGLPVEFHHHLDREELNKYYRQASIYWHATGFGVDEEESPQKVEHFGISTVEAMASGAVPVVINKGGQPEVLGEGLEFLLWNTNQECIQKTIDLIQDPKRIDTISKLAVEQSTQFDQDTFQDKLWKMVN